MEISILLIATAEDGLEFAEDITYGPVGPAENEYDIYLWIPVESGRNMTPIACVATIDQAKTSDEVYLIIMGKLF